jgi:CheY-like chemotaxis protein
MQERVFTGMPRQTVLAIADDEHTRTVIQQGLSSSRYSLSLSLSQGDGLSSLLEIKPDVVIMSIASPTTSRLAPLTQICEADPRARVIVVSPSMDNAFLLECIRHGASDYLRKPLTPHDLQRSMDRISSRDTMLRKALEPDRECVQEERKTLRFGNDLDSLPCILNQAVANAPVVCPDVSMLKMALGEILLNAIEHGNLCIGMEEKSAAMKRDVYPDLLRERREDPRYAARQVTLHVHMTRERLTYRIIDEGEGFDHKSLFKRDPHATAGSGLGLFVAKTFFTRMSFRGRGNEVVLVYDRPGEGEER